MTNLRAKALKLLDNYEIQDYSKADIKELLQELNIYQIELQLQNQELLEKENILLESKEELALLFREAPIGYIVLDDIFCVTKYNKKALEIFQFRNSRINPQIYTYFKNLSEIERFIEWTKYYSNKSFEIEIINKVKNTKWIELSHVKSNFNSKDIHLFSVIDITGKKQKSKQLHIFGTILEQLPVSVLITNRKSEIIYVNKELLKDTGYSYDEIIGQTPKLFKSGYTSKNEYKYLWETLEKGETWKGVFKNITKNGNFHWMATAISPIFDNENKEITHFISVETNIDEKVTMTKALETQENIMLSQSKHAAMGEMISMIAHQWRQPLSIISTIASGICLKKDFGTIDIDKDLDDLSEIVETTQYLSETINDFQNFFKKDKILHKINIEYIITKVLTLNKKTFDSNHIELKFINNSTININTYQNELIQVIINIINNAKDALILNNIDKSKEITIKTQDMQNAISIEISDNAGGIAEDIMNKIFEPYFTTKEPKSGTGLGLHIAKTIIEKHLQGSIKVQNNNQGALFTLIIPNFSKN